MLYGVTLLDREVLVHPFSGAMDGRMLPSVYMNVLLTYNNIGDMLTNINNLPMFTIDYTIL